MERVISVTRIASAIEADSKEDDEYSSYLVRPLFHLPTATNSQACQSINAFAFDDTAISRANVYKRNKRHHHWLKHRIQRRNHQSSAHSVHSSAKGRSHANRAHTSFRLSFACNGPPLLLCMTWNRSTIKGSHVPRVNLPGTEKNKRIRDTERIWYILSYSACHSVDDFRCATMPPSTRPRFIDGAMVRKNDPRNPHTCS